MAQDEADNTCCVCGDTLVQNEFTKKFEGTDPDFPTVCQPEQGINDRPHRLSVYPPLKTSETRTIADHIAATAAAFRSAQEGQRD